MFWIGSMPCGGPRSARCMVRSGCVAECGWDPGTVSSSSAKPGNQALAAKRRGGAVGEGLEPEPGT